MSGIGTNHPTNPFSPAGRAHGKSDAELRKQGLDPNGIPAAPQPQRPAAPGRPAGSRGQNIAQLAESIGDLELSNQDDLHAFCEAYRSVLNYLAVSAHLANGQLRAAARANARQTKDGWMTPAQRVKLEAVLKLVARDLNHLAGSCVAGATDAIKAWRRFEGLLDDLETSNDGRSRGGRGGFSVVK